MKPENYPIVVAEADNKWFEWISNALEKAEYPVRRAMDSNEALKLCGKELPALLITEQKIEDMDGVELTMEIRGNSALRRLPIIFFTDMNDKYTQLAAFNAGADMFITKGIRTKLFLARLAALLRRSYELPQDAESQIRQFGDIVIDEDQYKVSKNGDTINLSKKEFQLLLLLTSKPGKVFKRPYILARIWGDDIIVGDRNIDTHIKKLRKKIGKTYIKTTRGVGYKFIPPESD
jgi:two-component system alkaline phosphatase synthesis response regulator PhoP